MENKDLSSLVIKKVRRAWSAYTKQGACEKIESRCSWTIMLKHEGSTDYITSDGKKYISDRNHIIVAPAGGNYTWHCKEGGWISLIEFDAEINGFDKSQYDDLLCFETDLFSRLLTVQKEIELAKMGDADIIQPMQMKSLYEFITILLKGEKQQPLDKKNFSIIRPALEYMMRNYWCEKITNDALSSLCGISTVYFRKLFVQSYGVSPQTCIFRLRMESACELLKNGDCANISEVAIRVGYDDVYHFSKMFKKYSGVSPKNYIRQIHGAAVENRIKSEADAECDEL